MAGALDSKSRVIDFALTPVGRQKLADGQLIFEKATVSDRSSFYEWDGTGATDATQRLYFETYSAASDQITIESDDSGQLIPYGGRNLMFASLGEDIAGTSGANFSALKVLLTDDPDDPQQTAFNISGRRYIFYPTMADISRSPESKIDAIESVLFDKRLSTKTNFMFMPPVNADGSRLGYYSDVRQEFTGEDAEELMTGGKGTKYQAFISKFMDTSPRNTINLQIFQHTNEAGIKKLDLIDLGMTTFAGVTGHVVFAGRVLNNSYGFPVFVNILTLVLT